MLEPEDAAGSDLALLQYTSGSTSTPKGVMVTHANLIDNLGQLQRCFRYTRESTTVTWMPYFHDYGLIDGLLEPLYSMARCYVISPVTFIKRPWCWLDAVSRHGATHIHGPNFAYQLCIDRGADRLAADADLSSLVVAACAAEPIRRSTAEQFIATFASRGFRANAFAPAYGLAEATLVVSATPQLAPYRSAFLAADALEQRQCVDVEPDRPQVRAVISCGAPSADVPPVVVDPETGAELPDDAIGEIWLANPSVAAGYWQRPDETRETFGAFTAAGRGPMLRTGDLGFLRAGEVYLTGRLKDLLIVNGANHYPQDVEATVEAAAPDLRGGSVVAFPLETADGERLAIAAEVDRRGADLAAVVAAVRDAVSAEHGLACAAVVLLPKGSIFKTSSGKVQRRACKTAYLAGEFAPLLEWRAPQDVPPVRDWEEWLRRLVAGRRKVHDALVDTSEPFSALGLSSLEAAELAAYIEERAGRPLPVTALWEYPNIRALAGFLSSGGQPLAPAAAPVQVDEPIAIIGMACRFPGDSDTPEAFWRTLVAERDAMAPPPADRVGPGERAFRGGYLSDIFRFDAEFFGISDAEARALDPQQRLLLETAWHAFEDAGMPPRTVAGSDTGVFVGISGVDYAHVVYGAAGGANRYAATGTSAAIIANRLSYFLDLRGPSLTVDTACSASLVAVHQACQALRAGESGLAVVAGVNALLSGEVSEVLDRAGMLSPTGGCRPFDASADGYLRGEGCGVMVLKRLSAARRDGDRVLGVIRGSAVVSDGRSNGLSAPNGEAQRQVIRRALERARIDPAEVEYIEAHGTGTPLGDPIELHALADGYGRAGGAPCHVGAAKGTIGHLEGAAGIAGVMAAVLALRHDTRPPLRIAALNPRAATAGTRLALEARPTPWPARERPRLAAISSFGFGGTLAHVIVSDDPAGRSLPERPALPPHRFGGRRYRVEAPRETDALRMLLIGALSAVAPAPAGGTSRPATYGVHWVPVTLPGARANGAEHPCLVLGTPGDLQARVSAAVGRHPSLRRITGVGDADGQPAVAIICAAEPGRTGADRALRNAELVVSTLRALPGGRNPIRIWVVTDGAMPVGDGDPVSLDGACVWGIGKAAALEAPDAWGGLIDLPHGNGDSEADRLVDALLGSNGEDQLALRDGDWLAPRLERVAIEVAPARLREQAVYWVVGGSGALGRQAVRALIARGAQHIVVTGRRSTVPEFTGADVRFVRADVTKLADVQAALAAIDDTGLPLGGIIHAAGIGRESSLVTLDIDELREIAAAKVAGAWNLHRATEGRTLEFFIAFSSIASLWGAAGQAAYAAANHFLDMLCEHRRRVGLPGLAINWGPWDGGGLVTADVRVRLTRLGLDPIQPERAGALLGDLIGTTLSRVAAVDLRWDTFGAALTSRRPSPFVSDIWQRPASGELSVKLARALDLSAGSLEQVRTRVRDHVRHLVAEQLGDGRMPELERGFFDMGLDSLAVVAIRTSLSRDCGVPVTNADMFSYATIAALSERVLHLAGRLTPTPPAAAATAASPAPAALSREELLERIALEFDALGPAVE
jgi:acyl-CoA synthetase (AMP-forming)/AMP-acid ligase II/3-oxoacyl-(acyl-carrier-protein) synthase/acyl carrier protein